MFILDNNNEPVYLSLGTKLSLMPNCLANGKTLKTFNGSNTVEVDQMLQEDSDSTKPSDTFLVICSITCINSVLKMVTILFSLFLNLLFVLG